MNKKYFILLLVLFGLARHNSALAATNSRLPGVTVSPAFQQATVTANQSELPITFTVTNNKASTQAFKLSVADFNTLGESGGLFFAGANPTELQKKYGLAKWISLSQNQLTLEAGQTAKIQADILNLPSLTPGGHYGALMLELASNSSASSGNKVSVHPIASSLLFVTKTGGDTHKLSLADVSIKRSLFGLPSNITLRFHNDGNSHLVLRGSVIITNGKSKIVSKGIINEDSNIILPETFRQYQVPLRALAGASYGHYKLRVDFRFDGIDQFRSYQTTLFIVPLGFVVLAIIIMVVAIIAILRKKDWLTAKLKE